LTVAQVVVKDRSNKIRIPRHILIYCFHDYLKLSLEESANRVGQDHATALNACKKVKDCYLNDRELRGKLNALLDELNELAGKVRCDTLVVEISRKDILNLLPDLSDEERDEPMIKLWVRYKNR
jgi:abortive infection bacteriophage resistance protein